MGLVIVAVAVLIAALILGSVLAVLFATFLMIGVAIVVARAALARSRRARG